MLIPIRHVLQQQQHDESISELFVRQSAHRVRLRIIRVREWRRRTREIDKRVSSALISPERRRLTTTTVLFLLLYFVLAPETLRTSVQRRTITHIHRGRSGGCRFVRLILFGLLGLTYRGVTVHEAEKWVFRAQDGEREEDKRRDKKWSGDAYSLRFRLWLFMMGMGLGSKLTRKRGEE
jgi:hypothetical protein